MFNFKLDKEKLFFNEKEKKYFKLALKVLAILSALVVLVLILLVVFGPSPKTEASKNKELNTDDLKVLKFENYLELTDFVFPERLASLIEPSWKMWRTPLSKWGSEAIKQFWISTQNILLEKFSEINDNNIEKLLKNIK